MELLTALLLSGWPVLSTCFPRRYHFVEGPLNWTEAQTYCRRTYTDLAAAENSEEMKQLMDTVSSADHSSEFWLGLRTNNVFQWSDRFDGDGYRKWRSYEPDWIEEELCVRTENDIGWWDTSCMEQYPFICYTGTRLEPEFIAVKEPMTWFAAQSYCRENFTDLAKVWNNELHQKVQNLVPFGSSAWIGLSRPPLVWSDGTEFSLSWDGARPRGVSCGAASPKEPDSLDFQPCETRRAFVCYSRPAPVWRRVVKLRLSPADSVELNDPAVKADLLRKARLELKCKLKIQI
ncbi:macrophage mannose receptor 1-like [Leuresthes tenuis]|uniref:macrophage mannose receptor 1-like n=1 Tax=Leuresthes tenuis TaxID=355514 RepID=UPI003B51539D